MKETLIKYYIINNVFPEAKDSEINIEVIDETEERNMVHVEYNYLDKFFDLRISLLDLIAYTYAKP